jgi:hypothetical protein
MERSSTFRKVLGLLPAIAALTGANWRAMGEGSFSAPNYSLVTTHITSAGQACSGTTQISVPHDTPCTLSISVLQIGDETLKSGTASLDTHYKITSPGISNPDADWVLANDFLTHSYSLPGAGVTDVTLSARGTPPPNTAIDAGTYTANLVLTLSW